MSQQLTQKSPGVVTNTGIVFVANVAQMLIGFAVTAALAAYFGSAPAVEAFFIALPIPILLGQFTLSMTLMSLTPFYHSVTEAQSRDSAQLAVAPLFWLCMLFALALAIFIWFGSEWLSGILAPGFDPLRIDLLGEYLQATALVAPFIIGSNFLQSIANANNKFARPAFARPLMTAMAFGVLALTLTSGNLVGYFYGMAIGSAIGFFWQLSEVYSFGKFPLSLRGVGETWRKVKGSIGWLALSRGVGQTAEIGLQIIATLGAAGVVAVYGYGFKIAAIPITLAVSVGVALFPLQSRASAESDSFESRKLLRQGATALAALGALSGGFLFAWAPQIVTALYQRGDFDSALTGSVADVIRVFAVALVAVAINNALANVYWAEKRFKQRFFLQASTDALLLLSAYLLVREYGAVGLAGAYCLQFFLLTVIGFRQLSHSTREMLSEFSTVFRSIAAVAPITIVFYWIDAEMVAFDSLPLVGQGAMLVLAGLIFSGAYLATLWLIGGIEIENIFRQVISRAKGRMASFQPGRTGKGKAVVGVGLKDETIDSFKRD